MAKVTKEYLLQVTLNMTALATTLSGTYDKIMIEFELTLEILIQCNATRN